MTGQDWFQDFPSSVVRQIEPPMGVTAVPGPVAKIPLVPLAAAGSRYAIQVDPSSAECSTQFRSLAWHASQASVPSSDTVQNVPRPSACARQRAPASVLSEE